MASTISGFGDGALDASFALNETDLICRSVGFGAFALCKIDFLDVAGAVGLGSIDFAGTFVGVARFPAFPIVLVTGILAAVSGTITLAGTEPVLCPARASVSELAAGFGTFRASEAELDDGDFPVGIAAATALLEAGIVGLMCRNIINHKTLLFELDWSIKMEQNSCECVHRDTKHILRAKPCIPD